MAHGFGSTTPWLEGEVDKETAAERFTRTVDTMGGDKSQWDGDEYVTVADGRKARIWDAQTDERQSREYVVDDGTPANAEALTAAYWYTGGAFPFDNDHEQQVDPA